MELPKNTLRRGRCRNEDDSTEKRNGADNTALREKAAAKLSEAKEIAAAARQKRGHRAAVGQAAVRHDGHVSCRRIHGLHRRESVSLPV